MNNPRQNSKIIRKIIPVFSFFAILLSSFLISGSARQPESVALSTAPAIKNVSVTCRMAGAEIAQVLRKISMDSNIRIYTGEKLDETVTVSLFNAPLEEALKSVLDGNGYCFRYYRDGIFIEKPAVTQKKSSADGKAADGRPAMKRLFIAPSFVSITKVKGIVDSLKSPEATVSCDERSGVLVLDEKPEKADEIMERIRECDTFAAKSEETATATHKVTRLFMMKNAPVKDVLPMIRAKLTKEGTVFPNENLNSVIVTDTLDSLNAIDKIMAMYESTGGNPVVTIKVMEVPASILRDLKQIGYDIDPSRDIRFNRVNNRKYFSGILDKYIKFSDRLSADIGDFCEITTSFGSVTTRIGIAAAAEPDGIFRIRHTARETAALEGARTDERISFVRSVSGLETIKEDQGIVVTGFEKSLEKSITCSAFPAVAGFLPGLSRIASGAIDNERIAAADSVILLAIELSLQKDARGLPKFSFLNLLRLSESDPAAQCADWQREGAGYLDMFGKSPVDESKKLSEKPSKRGREQARTEKKKISRIAKAPAEYVAPESDPVPPASAAIFEDTPANRRMMVAENALKKELGGGRPGPAPEDETSAAARIDRLIENGELEKASGAASKYLASNPGSVKVLTAQGKAFKKMNRFVSASNAWRKALKTDPGNARLRESANKLDGLISFIISEKEKIPEGAKAQELESYLR